MEEKRYLNIDRKNRKSYVYSSLKNIAYKHDLRYQKSTNLKVVNGGKPDDILGHNWLNDEED